MNRKKICFFTLYNSKGASSKYRALQFRNDLEKKYDCNFFIFWNNRYTEKYITNKKKYFVQIFCSYIKNIIMRILQLILVAPKYNIVFLQKGVIPKSKINLIKYLKKRKVKIIFDVDDAIFINEKSKNVSEIISRESDIVIVGNNELKKYYSKFNNNIYVIPTVDHTPSYTDYIKDTFEDKIIGWIGSQSSISNLDILVEPINFIVEKYPKTKFYIISNDDYGYVKKIKNAKLIKWEEENYIENLSNITIGVMPLINNEFNKSKCGFKLIQYLNLEKPVLASDVGVNKDIVNNFGLICEDEKDWFIYLEKLLYDKKIYMEFQENIKVDFYNKFSYNVVLEKLINLFDGVENENICGLHRKD